MGYLIQIFFIVILLALVPKNSLAYSPIEFSLKPNKCGYIIIIKSVSQCQGIYTQLVAIQDFLKEPEVYIEGKSKFRKIEIAAAAPERIHKLLKSSGKKIGDFIQPQGGISADIQFKTIKEAVKNYYDFRNILLLEKYVEEDNLRGKIPHFFSLCKTCQNIEKKDLLLKNCTRKIQTTCYGLKVALTEAKQNLREKIAIAEMSSEDEYTIEPIRKSENAETDFE